MVLKKVEYINKFIIYKKNNKKYIINKLLTKKLFSHIIYNDI